MFLNPPPTTIEYSIPGEIDMKKDLKYVNNYAKENFPEILSTVTIFPPLEGVPCNASKIAKLFKATISKGIIISSYSILKHFKVLQSEVTSTSVRIGNTFLSIPEKIEASNLVLVFDFENCRIISLLVSKATSAEEFLCDHRLSEFCTSALLILLREFLDTQEFSLVGVVAAPDISRSNINRHHCHDDFCTKHFIFQEDCQDLSCFSRWFDSLDGFLKHLSKSYNQPQDEYVTNDGEFILKIANHVMVSIASHSNELPMIIGRPSQKIERLLLNSSQVEALYDPASKKVLIGMLFSCFTKRIAFLW